MAKVIQFPSPGPEKFGFKPVRKKVKRQRETRAIGFILSGKVISLNQLSRFEEALLLDDRGDKKARHLSESN